MQRHKGAYGYFSGERFVSIDDPEEVTDEIALNPAHFAGRPTSATLSTLAHEMAHLWQHHFGKPSRSRYHNKEWAAKMREVGLIPSDTGQPGGKETGQKVSHTIEPGGRFERACTAYLANRRRVPVPRPGRGGRRRHPQEESRQQDQVHLPGLRHERLGQARRPLDLRRLRRGDGSRVNGAGGRSNRHRAGFLRRAGSFARHQRSTSRNVIRRISVALSLLKSAGAGCSQIQGI